MLIIKRLVGQVVVIESENERFEIEVIDVRHGRARIDVAGNKVLVSKGVDITLNDASDTPLHILVDQVGLCGVRFGFKGDLSRRIYRKEGRARHAGGVRHPPRAQTRSAQATPR